MRGEFAGERSHIHLGKVNTQHPYTLGEILSEIINVVY